MEKRLPTKLAAVAVAVLALSGCAAPHLDAALGQANELASAVTGGARATLAREAAQRQASDQLATELPVMAIGGFNGSDPSPTLGEFQQDVADGDIHWFIASGGGMGGMGGGFGGSPNAGGSTSSDIATWVSESFEAQTVDGVTVYDLSGGTQ